MEMFLLILGQDEKKKYFFKTGTSSSSTQVGPIIIILTIFTLQCEYIPEIATSKKGWVMCRKKKLKKRNKYNYNEITSKH